MSLKLKLRCKSGKNWQCVNESEVKTEKDDKENTMFEKELDLSSVVLTPDTTPTKDDTGNAPKTKDPKIKDDVLDDYVINLKSEDKQLLTDIESPSKKKTMLDYMTRTTRSSRQTKDDATKTKVPAVFSDTKKSDKIEGKATPVKSAKTKKNTKKNNAKDVKENLGVRPLTDFYPLRKSSREPLSVKKKRQQEELEEKILNHCEDGLEVKQFPGKGRGVVAVRPFMEGEFIVEYKGDLIDSTTEMEERERRYGKNSDIGCYMYYFKANEKRYCLDATAPTKYLGRLLNHSRNGNCKTRVVNIDRHPYLILIAAKHIEPGEELLYDYGDRRPESIEAHPWLAY